MLKPRNTWKGRIEKWLRELPKGVGIDKAAVQAHSEV